MGIESMNRVNSGSFQGQGGSVKTAAVVSTAVPVETGSDSAAARDTVEISMAMQQKTAGQKVIREEGQASNEQIRQAVETINKKAQYNGEAVFGIHEATNRVTIKIVDKDTKEVIKEFPPEKTLDMIAKVWEMAGIMVDERR